MSFLRGLWKSSSKHKKLCEEWALANSRECVEGASWTGEWGERRTEEEDDAVDAVAEARFSLKYLGSTLVETPSSEEATAEAIKTVITMAKASGKKLPRVSLAVSLRGIRMTDLTTEEDQLQVSIYRISYCSADATHDHVFAFIATNLNETMECHAFLCPKRKMAQTVTLTVAQAFNTAYEAWQLSQADPRIREAADKTRPSTEKRYERNEKKKKKHPKEAVFTAGRKNGKREALNESQKNLLIDLSNEPKPTGNSWVCFEEDALQDSKGTPATPLTAVAARQIDNLEQNGGDNASAGASIAVPHQQQQQQQQQQHVLPRSSVGLKVRNAWPESRSIDLMCS